jgi:hypothetical protein
VKPANSSEVLTPGCWDILLPWLCQVGIYLVRESVFYGGNLQTLFRSRFNSWHFPNFGNTSVSTIRFHLPLNSISSGDKLKICVSLSACYYVFGNILNLLEYLNALVSRLCYCKPTFASSTEHSQIVQLYEREAPI